MTKTPIDKGKNIDREREGEWEREKVTLQEIIARKSNKKRLPSILLQEKVTGYYHTKVNNL